MARNYSSVVEPKALTTNITSSSATQITLNNVTGLPSAPYVLVINPDTAKEEVVLVTVDQTGVTSPTLKVQRGIEANGGVGVARDDHTIGDIVKHMIVGSDLQIVHDHTDNTSAHDATGGVVGLTKTQTLTNKTINLTSNTLTGTKAQFNAAVSDADFATTTGTETLTGKTVDLTNNTLTGTNAQFNTALSDADFATQAGTETLTNKTVNLTSNTLTGTIAQFNTALSDQNFATIAGTETLTSKTLTSPTITSPSISAPTFTGTLPTTSGASLVPVGMLAPFAGSTAPNGWLACEGQSLNSVTNTQYAALFAVIGTTYGGSSSSAFNVPDLRGRTAIGAGTGTGLTARTRGTAVGAETLPLHTHDIDHNHGAFNTTGGEGAHDHAPFVNRTAGYDDDVFGSGTLSGWRNAGTGDRTDVQGAHNHSIDIPALGTTQSGGAGTGTHGVMQPSLPLTYIIKY